MTIDDMVRIDTAPGQQGAVYQSKINLTGAVNSNAVALPAFEVYGIAVQITGTAILYATAYSLEDVESDDAVWSVWDGASEFNKSITAMKVENSSGSSEIVITVKVTEV